MKKKNLNKDVWDSVGISEDWHEKYDKHMVTVMQLIRECNEDEVSLQVLVKEAMMQLTLPENHFYKWKKP